MDEIIKVKNLEFSYSLEGTKVLKGISFSINKGEIVGIIGQNGSGKTTLVKHFNGLLKPIKGDVIINGKNTKEEEISELSKTTGYIFQNPDDQIFNNSILKEVSFGPKNLKFTKKRIKELVEKALKLTGLSAVKNKQPYDLPYNKRKLIAIASIISMDGEIIIFDEPTTGQDYLNREIVINIIKELKKKGKTIIVISHDMEFIAKICERAIVLKEGRILLDDSVQKVFMNKKVLESTKLKPPQITRLAQKFKRIYDGTLTVEEFFNQMYK